MKKALPKPTLADRLAAGPRHGIGPANALAARALKEPAILAELAAVLADERGVAVHRASNALKKVQRTKPELLAPYAKHVLRAAMTCEDIHARWNLTILLGGLPLKGRDRALAIELLFESLSDESALQHVLGLQALFDLSRDDAAMRRRLKPIVLEFVEHGTASMKARARKLLAAFR